jgi:hypothetical protein
MIEFEYVLITHHQWMHFNDILILFRMLVRQVVINREQNAATLYKST